MDGPPIDVQPPPRGRTAHRLSWRFLPPDLRRSIEARLGSPVVEARSCDGGFTPGFASVLTGADGSRLFVKAANRQAQARFAAAYAEEARKHRLLTGMVPAPALRFVDDGDWVVLGFEAVAGDTPRRPWNGTELDRCLDLAETIAESTVSVPEELGITPITEDLPALVEGWTRFGAVRPDWPHRDEAAGLARGFAALPADRFVHADLRDDNILLAEDGRALACDWNWPALAPPWIDLVTLLIAAYGDGLDAEARLGARELTRKVPAEHVDGWLAALAGFMFEVADRPVRSNSPHLGRHAAWYAAASWSWLCQRRGWEEDTPPPPTLSGDLRAPRER